MKKVVGFLISVVAVLLVVSAVDAGCGGLFQRMHERRAARLDARAHYHATRAAQIGLRRAAPACQSCAPAAPSSAPKSAPEPIKAPQKK